MPLRTKILLTIIGMCIIVCLASPVCSAAIGYTAGEAQELSSLTEHTRQITELNAKMSDLLTQMGKLQAKVQDLQRQMAHRNEGMTSNPKASYTAAQMPMTIYEMRMDIKRILKRLGMSEKKQ